MNTVVHFVNQSNFTIRRANKFPSGNFTNMTVEQRFNEINENNWRFNAWPAGITDSTLNKCIRGLPAAHDVCANLEKYIAVCSTANSEQRVDARPSGISRDESDFSKSFLIGCRLIRRSRK